MKGGKTIKLREAAIISGYHPDYLSYLIRNKKLLGFKKGHDWYVGEAELRAYVLKRQQELQQNTPIIKKISYKKVFWPWLAFAGLAIFLLAINYFFVGWLNIDQAVASDEEDSQGATKVIQTYYNDQGGNAVSSLK